MTTVKSHVYPIYLFANKLRDIVIATKIFYLYKNGYILNEV